MTTVSVDLTPTEARSLIVHYEFAREAYDVLCSGGEPLSTRSSAVDKLRAAVLEGELHGLLAAAGGDADG